MKRIFFILFFFCMGCADPSLKGQTYLMHKGKRSVELVFDEKEDKFSGAIDNRFFGTYLIDKDKIHFKLVGTTMMLPHPDVQELEAEFLNDLTNVIKYKLEKGKLVLLTKNQKTLVFQKVSK